MLSPVRVTAREVRPLVTEAPSAQATDSPTVSSDSVLLFMPSPLGQSSSWLHTATIWSKGSHGWRGN